MAKPLAVAFLIPVFASAQWSDVRQIGTGGEAFVATDGKGNVYVTSHQPAQLLVSRDYGDSFGDPFKFRNALGDLHVIAWGEGRVAVSYMYGSAEGLKTWFSTDSAKNLTEGQAYPGPYDREWLAVNPKSNEVYLNYSDGYIGGEKSKGVYLASSSDNGENFKRRSRIDQEATGSYAVDPYLTCTPSGRLYAAWAASKDYDTIDAYRFAMSDDGGKTWARRQTIADTHKTLGDTQERWMLGGILSVGEDTVIVYYQDYAEIEFMGRKFRPLLTWYRRSDDAGATFGEPQTLTPRSEIEKALRAYETNRKADRNYPLYMQTLPWMCAGPDGGVYAVFQDNRGGQSWYDGEPLNVWAVRSSTLAKGAGGFAESEKVSGDTIARRPPLDFMCCAADEMRLYVVWTESSNPKGEWEFSGKLMFGRKKLKS